ARREASPGTRSRAAAKRPQLGPIGGDEKMKLIDLRAAARAAAVVLLWGGLVAPGAAVAASLRHAYIDCDGDHSFDPAIDKPLSNAELKRAPDYGIATPPADCAPARAANGDPVHPGFVLPRGASLSARQLQIVVDGDVTIEGRLTVHSIAGGRPAAFGNAFG